MVKLQRCPAESPWLYMSWGVSCGFYAHMSTATLKEVVPPHALLVTGSLYNPLRQVEKTVPPLPLANLTVEVQRWIG